MRHMLRPILVACALALTACGSAVTAEPPASTSTQPTSRPASHTPAAAVATPEVCAMPDSGFECDFQKRIKAAQAYAETRPGTVGIVLRDRKSGVMWRNDHADDMTWTASTIKLAMVVNLLERHRAGKIKLSNDDRRLMTAMLHSSDDDAASGDSIFPDVAISPLGTAAAAWGRSDGPAESGSKWAPFAAGFD